MSRAANDRSRLAILASMALPRFEKLPEDRRRRVIAAAAVEFARKGYKGAALGAIAKQSGMAKASFYYYFADKADLCATVLREAWRLLSPARRTDLQALTAETFWPAIEALARENMALCHGEPWLLAAAKLLNRASIHPPGETVFDEYREARHAWEVDFIRRGQELGTIRKDVPAELLATISLAARQASNLWILDRMAEMSAGKVNELALHSFEIYHALLAPQPLATAPDAAADSPRTRNQDARHLGRA